MMGEAIEERAREAFAAKHAGPFIKGQVGRNEGSPALIAAAKDFEESLRPHCRKRDIAQLIDDEEVDGGQVFLPRPQPCLIAGL